MKIPKLRFLLGLCVALLATGTCEAGLKVYFLRHAEAGHNVKKLWKDKPREQWPAYVGNPNLFTPTGEQQVAAAVPKLKQYTFDFIAVSPAWRARHTVLPYLKDQKRKGEIWPELAEFEELGFPFIASTGLPPPHDSIFTGEKISLPGEEAACFDIRADGPRQFALTKEPKQAAADINAILAKVVARIRQRFGGSEKSILLVGHSDNGLELLCAITRSRIPRLNARMKNTGMWMAEEQPDGSFKPIIYDDLPYGETPAGKSAAK